MAELEFKLPDEMQLDEEEIHARMIQGFPRNYDVSEGALLFDTTKPTALEKAKMIQFNLAYVLQMMFPQFAEEDFLNYHGESIKLPRHPAQKAVGQVLFSGEAGTFIPTGTVVMTAAGGDVPPIQFATSNEGTLDQLGKATLQVEALEPGVQGNVPADAIMALEQSISGVTALSNAAPTLDGADAEDDTHYRARIMDRRQNQALSGARRDYKAWAMEVEGVGDAIVIPEANGFGTGTTNVLITARDGGAASAELIHAVQQHIAPDGRDGGGLAPIGALVSVGTVEQLPLHLSFASISFAEGYTELDAFNLLKEKLGHYFAQLSSGGLIRHTHIGSLIIATGAIQDYDGMLLNGSSANIQLTQGQVAAVGEVTIRHEAV